MPNFPHRNKGGGTVVSPYANDLDDALHILANKGRCKAVKQAGYHKNHRMGATKQRVKKITLPKVSIQSEDDQ